MQGESAEGERRKQIEEGVQGLQSRGPAAGPDREASPLQPVGCVPETRGPAAPHGPSGHLGLCGQRGLLGAHRARQARRCSSRVASLPRGRDGSTAIYSGVAATPNASKSQPKKYAN